MSQINQLFNEITNQKDSILLAQDALDTERSDVIYGKLNLQHRTTGLWLIASVVGGHYVWSNWSPSQEGQSLFSALASRSWTRLELAVAAGYGVLSMAVLANRTIADLCYGPLREQDQDKELLALSKTMGEYLTANLDEENRVPVDRLQHLLALNLDPAELRDLISAAVGGIGSDGDGDGGHDGGQV